MSDDILRCSWAIVVLAGSGVWLFVHAVLAGYRGTGRVLDTVVHTCVAAAGGRYAVMLKSTLWLVPAGDDSAYRQIVALASYCGAGRVRHYVVHTRAVAVNRRHTLVLTGPS